MQRRRLLFAAAPLCLAGCGFQLRRAAALQIDSIALTGFAPRSPMGEELRSVLARSITVEASPDKAQVVLHSITEARSKWVVAFTTSGQVRDLRLRSQFIYRVDTPAGRELVPSSEINLYRDMSFVEVQAQGKAQEAEALYREMQSDMVHQVILRLSAIHLD